MKTGILFCMTVRMRHTRAHTANRRSHHALKEAPLSKCNNCNLAHARHHVCEKCGFYKGKKIIDVVKQAEKRQAKAKERQKEAEPQKEPQKEAQT